ncbi:MAG: histidine phosphatase family protein [Loktanella sp.]|nr:histidine phosphatase family protein [Loktanella sp.]
MPFPELYILRHGQTEWNAENRMQGALNSPLTAKGEADAARQGNILAGRDLTGFQFWCSPQGRAIQTAAIALGRIALDIHTDDRLREIKVGDWSGLLRDTLPLPDGPDPYALQYDMAPNGEGFQALEIRARAFLNDLTGPAVLVTHGITSRVLRRIIAGDAAIADVTAHGGQGCVYHLKNGRQTLLD